MKKQPSIFGGACIIASVCVGAGMLGLPTSGAGAWTLWSALAILLNDDSHDIIRLVIT